MSASKNDHTESSPWEAQKLDVTGSWSASKTARKQRTTTKVSHVPETLVAPIIEPAPNEAAAAGDLLAGRFEAVDDSEHGLDWDPDGDTDALAKAASADDAFEEADAPEDGSLSARSADEIDVELLSAADPSTDAPTGEMTIPSFLAPEDTVESEVPRVVAGRAANGFVSDAQGSVWARGPVRAKAFADAPRIELRRRSRRPLARIDDGSAAETTEWMAQGAAQPSTDAEGVPFGPRVGEPTDGHIDVQPLADDAIEEVDPEPVRMDPADVVYVRRASVPPVEGDQFRTFVLQRRGPEDELPTPAPAWIGMLGQAAIWIVVVAGGIGLGCLAVMAIMGRLPF
jgi:hypothetical protein